MDLVADGLLISASFVAALYCHVLARRLRKLGDLDAGLGGAIAALSRQADDLRRAIELARKAAGEQSRELARRTARAEAAAGRLEILIAAMHDAESRAPVPRAPVKRRYEIEDEDDDSTAMAGVVPETASDDAALEAATEDAPQDAADDAPEERPEAVPAPQAPGDSLAAAIRALARGGRS